MTGSDYGPRRVREKGERCEQMKKNQRVSLVLTSMVLWTGSVRSETARNVECGLEHVCASAARLPTLQQTNIYEPHGSISVSALLASCDLQVPDAFPHAPVPFGAERARDHHHISASYIMLLTDGQIALSSLTFVPSSLPLFHHTVS
jgi:hypothetical protein